MPRPAVLCYGMLFHDAYSQKPDGMGVDLRFYAGAYTHTHRQIDTHIHRKRERERTRELAS